MSNMVLLHMDMSIYHLSDESDHRFEIEYLLVLFFTTYELLYTGDSFLHQNVAHYFWIIELFLLFNQTAGNVVYDIRIIRMFQFF